MTARPARASARSCKNELSKLDTLVMRRSSSYTRNCYVRRLSWPASSGAGSTPNGTASSASSASTGRRRSCRAPATTWRCARPASPTAPRPARSAASRRRSGIASTRKITCESPSRKSYPGKQTSPPRRCRPWRRRRCSARCSRLSYRVPPSRSRWAWARCAS